MKRFWERSKEQVRVSRRIRKLEDLADRAGKNPHNVRAIVLALNDQSEEVRLTAARCLFSTLEHLHWIDSRCPIIDHAVKALESIEEFHPGTIPILIDALGVAHYHLQKPLQSSLVKIGEPAFPALEEAVRTGSVKLRRAAIEPLARVGSSERVLPLLQQCLKDLSPLVRSAAVSGIASFGSEDASCLLLEMLGDENDSIQRATAAQLAKNIDRSTNVLVDALNYSEPRFFQGATRALAYCLDRDAVDKFVTALEPDLRQRVEDQIADWHDQWNRVWIIIDNGYSVRLVLRTLFQMWGRVPLEFEDGYQGMQWVEDFRAGRYDGPTPELVIADCRMPGPQGYEVCGEMRKIPEFKEVAMVLTAAWRLHEDELQRIAQVEIDYKMDKPLPMPDELRAILEDVIDKRQRKISGQ